MSKQNGLDTIWEVPDDLWEEIEPVITELDPPQGHRAQEAGPPQDAQRYHLSYALRIPVEQAAETPW